MNGIYGALLAMLLLGGSIAVSEAQARPASQVAFSIGGLVEDILDAVNDGLNGELDVDEVVDKSIKHIPEDIELPPPPQDAQDIGGPLVKPYSQSSYPIPGLPGIDVGFDEFLGGGGSVAPYESAPRDLLDDVLGDLPVEPPPKLPTPPKPRPKPPPVPGLRSSLEDIKQSLDFFTVQSDELEEEVIELVSIDVQDILNRNMPVSVQAYDDAKRARKVAEILESVHERSVGLSTDIRDTLLDSSGAGFDPVLKSTLDEIELLIEGEAGVDVDLSASARAITSSVAERTAELIAAQEDFRRRNGLDLYQDTDNDGISDYDEFHIYKTDPFDAHTGDSVLTDGERILLGFDPFATTTVRVSVESPQIAGEVAAGLFELHSILIAPQTDDREDVASSSVEVAVDTPAGSVMVFAGKALPNSFVTLYIFSTPIVVTVKADRSGQWSYMLETEIEDGTHEVHVATVDSGGRILAKSPPVSFVKTAEAIEFTPLLAPVTQVDPLDTLTENLAFIIGIVLMTFALVALAMLGLWRKPAQTVLDA